LNITVECISKFDSEKEYLFSISTNVYRVKSYFDGFNLLFHELTDSNQVVEGLVLKRRNARLELGNTELNNTKSQIKCRVSTKNYKY
jgi:hypothetical protein